MGIGNLFGLLDKLMGILPIQKREERWRNELDKLEKEKKQLLQGVCDDKKARRLVVVNSRIDHLNRLCKNATK